MLGHRSTHVAASGRSLLDELLTRCTFPPAGSEVTCAVSGGADSTALLALACHAGLVVTAAHVDHGIRAGSETEADLVADSARRCGARFVAHRVRVAPGPGLEARARTARYAVLPADVATGHTADDQAETVLLHLLRGSATRGLAGMRTGPRHPILGLRRSETVALCRALDLITFDDPSNADGRHVRNRLRAEVLPLLDHVSGRDPVPILTRQAALLRDDDDLLEALAAEIDATDAPAVSAAALPLARRAIRRWIEQHDPLGRPPDGAAVQRVLDVASGRTVACELSDGRRVERHAQRLSFATPRDEGTTTGAE